MIQTPEWPRFSPDFNPIKRMWVHANAQIDEGESELGLEGISEVARAHLNRSAVVNSEALEQDQIRNLIGSMPVRCQHRGGALVNLILVGDPYDST